MVSTCMRCDPLQISMVKHNKNIMQFFSLLFIRLIPPLCIEVHVPSHKSDRSCICVLGVSILPFSTIILLGFGTVPTVWYFFVFFFIWLQYILSFYLWVLELFRQCGIFSFFLHLTTIYTIISSLGFGTVPTVWYFFVFFIIWLQYIV